MSILGQFAASVGAMTQQSKKMETISLNIANLNTGGYKRTETHFSTILAQTYDNNRDIGGVRGISRSMISQQGGLLASDSNLDVAINGNGFFVLNTEVDGSGSKLYGRDGSFEQALGDEFTTTVNGNSVTLREGYLVDKNGYFVQGWPVNEDQETFPTDEESLGSIRMDPETFTSNGEATTEASIGLNLPADQSTNYSESTFIKAYDTNGDLQSYQLKFTNMILGAGTETATPTWNLPSAATVGTILTQTFTVYDDNGFDQSMNAQFTKTAADTWDLQIEEGGTQLDIDGTNDGTANPLTLTFDPLTGNLLTVPTISVASQVDNGSTFALDFTSLTQNNVGASITETGFNIDGVPTQQGENAWTLEVFEQGGSQLNIDTDTTPTRLQLNFDGQAQLVSPTSVTIAGTGTSFSLDLTDLTQYASGNIYEVSYDYNGRSDATMTGISFDDSGRIIGTFSDATQRPIYKLPLATFTNPDGLEPINGNVYKHDPLAGDLAIRTADGQGAGVFVPNAREMSNVEMADEFTQMIVTQNAYNTASTVVKTIDEMTEVARDLKA